MSKIILIEDDEALRKQLRFSLESSHEISEAGNRLQAIDMLKSAPHDIAVVDLGLPPNENSPDEGLFIIDHINTNYTCKIIVLTGQNTKEAAVKSLERGSFDYLEKPVNMEKLLFSIERAELFIQSEEELRSRGFEKIQFQAEIGKGLQNIRESAEKNLIIKVLNDTGFNVYQSAKILGVKRESLYYFIKKFNLERTEND